uniref:DekiORF51 n=1 Tax=Dendrolimus kikuchii nucleopolyhedrovirus TaxID=1219875 RepID=V9LSQ1_9ABAC|nr:DekiORF51 [Dendrolimus kikuchii nucleopolyhedrovirus]
MAINKVNFVDGALEVFTVQDDKQENWMAAGPFAEALNYSRSNEAIQRHVSAENKKTLEELQGSHLTSSLHPQTEFINTAGVFELIAASEMPAAKQFGQWNVNDLPSTPCAEEEYDMAVDALANAPAESINAQTNGDDDTEQNTTSLDKFQFANLDLEIVTVKDDDSGQLWMLANPFARVLDYTNARNAVSKFVSDNNQICYNNIKAHRSEALASSLHPQSKFINRAGLFELIQGSKMPRAQEFKRWINSDLLPKLCAEGEYSMAADAPADIAEGMNAVHAATDEEGREAPWARDLEIYKQTIKEKDEKIDTLTTALAESNGKIITFANALVEANAGLVLANKNLHDANQTIGHMANRMADIAQDVVAKPDNPQLLHSLAVCALGNEEYAFLRAQKRSLNRSLKRLGSNDVVFSSDYVPNAMNVLNRVKKETLPRNRFRARHNKITLLENLTREQLVEAVQSTMTERQIAKLHRNTGGNNN